MDSGDEKQEAEEEGGSVFVKVNERVRDNAWKSAEEKRKAEELGSY